MRTTKLVSLAALCAATAAVVWNGLPMADAWLHPEKSAVSAKQQRWSPDIYANRCDPSVMDGTCLYGNTWEAWRDTNIEFVLHPELVPVFDAMRHTFDGKADLDCKGTKQNDYFCPGVDLAILRMRDVLQGPFDYYLNAAETKAAADRVRSTIDGVGISLRLNHYIELLKAMPKGVTIDDAVGNFVIGPGHELVVATEPTEGPAKGVLKVGDVIVSVKHMADSSDAPMPVAGMHYREAIAAIRGERGTAAEITYERTENGVTAQNTVKLTRATIVEHTVHVTELKTPKGKKIFNVKLDHFDARTFLDELLPQLAATGKTADGYIFEFDGNPGGNLGNAYGLIEATQENGVVISQEVRPYKANHLVFVETYLIGGSEVWVEVPIGPDGTATGPANFHTQKRQPLLINPEIPIVARVNGLSASASEIVAGAWQASGRATLVGTRTVGKDKSQVTVNLPYGRSAHIPTGEFYPGGRKMPGGLVPDREVVVTWEDVEAGRDPVLDASLAVLDEKIAQREELAQRVKAAGEEHQQMWDFQMCMRITTDQLPQGTKAPEDLSDKCAQAVGIKVPAPKD